MLVLGRGEGQRVMIEVAGVTVVVTLIDTRRGRGKSFVRLGFEAPREVRIVREELLSKGGDA